MASYDMTRVKSELEKFLNNNTPGADRGAFLQAAAAMAALETVNTLNQDPDLIDMDYWLEQATTDTLNSIGAAAPIHVDYNDTGVLVISSEAQANSAISVSAPLVKTVVDNETSLSFDQSSIDAAIADTNDAIDDLSNVMTSTLTNYVTVTAMESAIAVATAPLATTAALTAATTDKVSALTRSNILNSINVTSPLTISQNSAGDVTLGSIANQYRRWASLDLGSHVILPIERNGNTVNCCWCTPLTGQQNAYNDWVIQSNKLPKSLTPTEGYAYLIGSAGNYTLVLRFGTDGSIYQMNYNQTIPSGLNVAWQGRWTTTNPINVD